VFRIVESLDQLRSADCTGEKADASLIYPITGSVGMYEIVRTYVGLERLTTLVKSDPAGTKGDAIGKADTPGDSTDTPVVFSDVLTFTTELGGGIQPSLALSAVGVGSFKLTFHERAGLVAPNAAVYNPYGSRTARTLEALQQKRQYAKTQVVIELERRRGRDEEEAYLERLAEILKP